MSNKVLNAKSQVFRYADNGGYHVLHPTRGWRYVSGKRVAAQGRMAKLKGLGA
jgi:hypothetical protein